MTCLRKSLFVMFATFAFAPACGDNHVLPMPDAPVDSPSEFDEDGCRILSVGRRDFQFNFFDQLLGARFPVTPNLAGERGDVLHVELYDSTTPDLPPLTTGTFDLSLETCVSSCQHCVWVELDATDDGTVDAIYFATEGMLTIDKVEDPLGAVFAAHWSRIVLRRATVGDNGQTQLVPGGDCVSISNVSFDTTPTPGEACESAEDCGNALLEICDPSNNKCADPECDFDTPCTSANEVCLVQYRDLFFGACYQTCNPSAQSGGCPATQQCVQRGPHPDSGICKYTGTGALGSTCELEDNSSSCVAGAVCSRESYTCVGTCSFFANDTGCAAGTVCSLFQLCEPPSAGVPVTFGQACGDAATQAQGCASDGEAFRGLCFGYEGDPLTCHKTCLGDRGCSSGEFCAQRYSSGVGICLPLPVCGDGVRGEINEVCDDGNTMDGDGCSSDCTTVDENYLCTNAETLVLGTTTQGDTSTAIDGFMSSCQAGLARATLFDVTPPGPGRLRLHLTSASSQTLSLRTTCEDASTELVCRGQFGVPTDQELIVQVTNPTPTPFTAMISANTVLEEGSYSLQAEFVPEDCGDGVVAGREACDDMNETSNDGCSADCSTIEYGYYCAQAPALSTTATINGTLAGAPLLYEASCAADDGAAIHPTRMYTFVAPAAGTLHLKLTDGAPGLAILSVRGGCGAPGVAPELSCRAAFLNGEIDVPLTGGQAITAVVTSFFAEQELGTFTLEATFTAQ
jgi:cysteine-rich repeat protein